MEIPSNCRYTKDHEWIKVDGQLATIGITSFAQGELGDIVFVELPAIGRTLKQKETICVVESTKAASDVYAPVSGTVTEVNKTLSNSPDLVNKNPHNDGWMVKLKDFSKKEYEALMTAEQYRTYLGDKA
jgi:glycine cleavage system H protein